MSTLHVQTSEKEKRRISRRHVVKSAGALGLMAIFSVARLRAEPITFAVAAAFVGEKLLEGALQRAGGMLLSAALGEATITDVKSWIQAAVREIEAFVAEELRRQLTQLVLDEIQADLQGIINNIRQYALLSPSNRLQNKYLLETVDIVTAARIYRSSSYDQAYPVYAALMAYRLIARNELFLLDKDPGHILSLREEMNIFCVTLKGIQQRVGARLMVDVRLKFNGCKPLPRGEGGPNMAECSFIVDGQEFSTYTDPPRQTLQMEANELKQRLQRDADEFNTQISQYLFNSTKCFDSMCKKVNQSYPVIQKVPSKSARQVDHVKGVLFVPGAILINR